MLPAALTLLTFLVPAEPTGPMVVGAKEPLKPIARVPKDVMALAVSDDGRIYVARRNEILGWTPRSAAPRPPSDDRTIWVVQGDKAVPFAVGPQEPLGMACHGRYLFVTDRQKIWRIDHQGNAETYVELGPSPGCDQFQSIVADSKGTLYVACATRTGGKPRYRLLAIQSPTNMRTVLDSATDPLVRWIGRMSFASEYHLDLTDPEAGVVHRVRVSDGKRTTIQTDTKEAYHIAGDHHGRTYLSSTAFARISVIARPGEKPIPLASGNWLVLDLCLAPDGKSLLVADFFGGLYAVPTTVPGAAVDESPLPVEIVPAFSDVKWKGWKPVDDKGKPTPHRPILLTHAGDGSHRVFVPTQQGVVHVFPNDPAAKESKVFLDLQDRVRYHDSENEEGFLGLAFHPHYRKNGELFIYYTSRKHKLTNIVSRFKVSKDDPDRADPASEEVLLELPRPFWNHNGGTLAFGPDGCLYIAIGDGGSANDPFNNGQNPGSLLGKILRIDVDRRDQGKRYAVPKDNPFVGKAGARPEVWAYGLRNVWRMAFDRQTGQLWAADVGQNLWEEINLVKKGGNYGWRPREGLHPFGDDGVGPNPDLIDPIWEYHHAVGKSITGGTVYRGMRVPALQGLYLYADYVSGHVWALRHDAGKKRVTANHLLRKGGFPVYSFGEDERGEVYLLTSTPSGQGIFTFAQTEKPRR